MAYFKDLSIRRKLTLSLTGITSLAVLAACLAFYAFIINHYRQAYSSDIMSLAKVISFNCRASLTFDIPEDAEKVLLALENRPSILAATVYDNNHNLFASYGNTAALALDWSESSPSPAGNSQSGPQHPVAAHHDADGPKGTLLIHQDIFMDGQKIGCITLLDDMRSITTFRNFALFSLGGIFILIIAIAFLVAARLRDAISRPISDLAAISREITEKQDFSLRAIKHGNDEVGHLVDSFNNMLDHISQRSRELKNSEQRFRGLVNQAVDSFFLHDLDGNIIDVNQRACDTLGYDRNELLALTVEDIDKAADNRVYREKYWASMRPNSPVSLESIYMRKDGTTLPVEIREGLMELEDRKVILALVRDMTEKRESDKEKHRLEHQLQQAQKMESIGTLAAGIAHDFNNILSPIYGYVELAQMKVEKDSIVMNYLGEVNNAAHRAGELVKQILTFSRQDTEKFSPVEVHVIIKEALKLLRATIPTTIEIKQEIDTKSGYVLANPTQVHQVLMNLCTNAYHAMRETGGKLGVSLSRISITPDDALRNINLRPGNYLLLEVSDTGTGMDKDTIARIFEPYFTTKAQGEGTGMGLSVVHGIIQSHGGDITVYSEVGKGSIFHVYLPALETEVDGEDALPEGPPPKGMERILLVDDEQSVLKVEKEILENLGYSLVTFTSPEEALEHFREQPEAYDLVITDMTMPGITGDKLAREILALRPDIPIVMCTGFSELINREEAFKIGIRKFVTKPIVISSFARTLREALAKR
jgi:PAS domain S-box-containing protein